MTSSIVPSGRDAPKASTSRKDPLYTSLFLLLQFALQLLLPVLRRLAQFGFHFGHHPLEPCMILWRRLRSSVRPPPSHLAVVSSHRTFGEGCEERSVTCANTRPECLDLFVRRFDELASTKVARSGCTFKLRFDEPALSSLPTRHEFIAFLAFIRQFFFHTHEPIEIRKVLAAFRQVVQDGDLLKAVDLIDDSLIEP